MNGKTSLLTTVTLAALTGAACAATIVVNTADNTDFSAGQTNLVRAISLLADGDTIQFNIPGAGPHYLVTPAMVTGIGGGGGYPEITQNNVTIDGYSQPGAAPNTNPILAANNAQIKIVLDSRGGGAHVWDISGYGTSESGALVVSGNNVTIKGLSFLGIYGDDNDVSPKRYAISLGRRGGNDAHIAGCWIGVDPDGTTVAGFADGITGFRHRDPTDVLVDRTVVGVKAGSSDPRAEFNVLVDLCIPIIIEGAETRVSGNFIGVLPDGLTRVPNPVATGFGWEGHMELARAPYNIVIGTDGDGVNDADERNLLSGGVHSTLSTYTTESSYDHLIEFYGGGTRTNIIIAGNYIGVGVDGSTMFTNATRLINNWGTGAEVQIGSDFDGVSDEIEGNVIANYHPSDVFSPSITYLFMPAFAGLDVGERVSLRGNVLINNNLSLYSYGNGNVTAMIDYYAPYMDTSGFTAPLPVLDTNSVYPNLKGTFPAGLAPYTNIIVDVYQLDPEGWAYGTAIGGWWLWPELTDFTTYTNGFPQGRKYLGSRVVANTGSFDVDISDLAPGVSPVTVAVNYSADPPGTTRGKVQTGNFSNPIWGPQITVTQGEEIDLAELYSTNDLLQGLIPTELPGDKGWHPANTDPQDQLPAFTDGQGILASGLTGLLNDFPGAGVPAKLVRYTLPLAANLEEIRVFTGNNGRDGRVFHTYTVRFSSDGGETFTPPVYVQSHPSGTLNNGANNQWRVALSQLTSPTGELSRNVTHIDFNFYSVDNTGGQMRDPFDGLNPFTGTDDLLTAAFVSPLVWEIDVLGTPIQGVILSATLAGTNIELTWVSQSGGQVVQAASQLAPPNWADMAPQPVITQNGTTNTTSIPIGIGPQFFRLRNGP